MFYRNFSKEKFNVMFKATGQADNKVEVPGLHYHALAGRVIIHRDAGVEYRKLLNQMAIRHSSRRSH